MLAPEKRGPVPELFLVLSTPEYTYTHLHSLTLMTIRLQYIQSEETAVTVCFKYWPIYF
jgi:hypothetical protein